MPPPLTDYVTFTQIPATQTVQLTLSLPPDPLPAETQTLPAETQTIQLTQTLPQLTATETDTF